MGWRPIVGLGIDLIEVSRVESALRQWGDKLIQKLMDPDEALGLARLAAGQVETVALSIALKEAASKAIGTGWSRGVRWRDVVVCSASPPSLELRERAADFARLLGSDGTSEAFVDRRGDLIIAEVRLIRRRKD
jgi:holo-[acyl-carrier protein] synthase